MLPSKQASEHTTNPPVLTLPSCLCPTPVSPVPQAYRVACHYGDSEEQVEESMRIASSAVYNKLMLFVLVSSGWGQRMEPDWRLAAGLRSEIL